jgi:hypothetical protein
MAKTTKASAPKKVASAKLQAPAAKVKVEVKPTGAKSAPFKLDGSNEWHVQHEDGSVKSFEYRFRARQYSKTK